MSEEDDQFQAWWHSYGDEWMKRRRRAYNLPAYTAARDAWKASAEEGGDFRNRLSMALGKLLTMRVVLADAMPYLEGKNVPDRIRLAAERALEMTACTEGT